MGKPTGFLETARTKPLARPVTERIRDWKEVYLPVLDDTLQAQASRCMDCGIPFCHQGCPLGNVIPDWNDLVFKDRWREASAALHATNNFPEFTGRLCPAPCESSCVLGIADDPVTIRSIELSIAERAFSEGWLGPEPPVIRTGKRVAIVGSGPAGLAAADQLNRAGHTVVVFERADRIGGLLRYGIPEFKLEKRFLERRLDLLRAEGVQFRTNANVGGNVPVDHLRRDFDAVVLAIGSTRPRDLPVPGRELKGIHFAMDYLTLQNRRCEAGHEPAERQPPQDDLLNARGKRVVIIGGGDTGADCLGTAHRQGARSVHQLELLPQPPGERAADNPWPQWPNVFRVSAAHEEGGERVYSASTTRFTGDDNGCVTQLHAVRVGLVAENGRTSVVPEPGTEFTLPADLVILAMGFTGPEQGLVTSFGLETTARGTIARNDDWMTSQPGVFVCGDAQRGQSLIVWAIADGRDAARGVDEYLSARCAVRSTQ
jgi:glutamate synthase (NADPH/NADH) small chain